MSWDIFDGTLMCLETGAYIDVQGKKVVFYIPGHGPWRAENHPSEDAALSKYCKLVEMLIGANHERKTIHS